MVGFDFPGFHPGLFSLAPDGSGIGAWIRKRRTSFHFRVGGDQRPIGENVRVHPLRRASRAVGLGHLFPVQAGHIAGRGHEAVGRLGAVKRGDRPFPNSIPLRVVNVFGHCIGAGNGLALHSADSALGVIDVRVYAIERYVSGSVVATLCGILHPRSQKTWGTHFCDWSDMGHPPHVQQDAGRTPLSKQAATEDGLPD
jgi:hypothetical protein